MENLISTSDVDKIVKRLQQEYQLPPYEALKIAVQIHRNNILQSAFVVSSNDSYPSALEKIGIHLKEIAYQD